MIAGSAWWNDQPDYFRIHLDHHKTIQDIVCLSKKVWKYFSLFKEAPVKVLYNTAWKVFMLGVFLVRIFAHSDWIRRNTPYLSVSSPNVGNHGPEKLLIRILVSLYKWPYNSTVSLLSFDAQLTEGWLPSRNQKPIRIEKTVRYRRFISIKMIQLLKIFFSVLALFCSW